MSDPLSMFYKWEKETPGQLLFHQPFPEGARTYTYAHAGEEIRRLAAALIAMNMPPRSRVSILSKNCAHWIMADFAIWMAGHISVPLYPTLSAHAIRQILEHSEAKVVFVGKLDDYEHQRDGIPANVRKISFPFYGINEGLSWNELIENNKPIETNPTFDRHEMATIKYTSGTTGVPKGVMLSFHSIDHVLPHAFNIMGTGRNDRFFSYLPLSHIAERMLVELGAIYNGATIYFSESLEKFASNLAHAQPTVFLAVPRIWAKFREKILEKLPQKKLNLLLSIPIVSTLVKRKIKTNLGLIKCNWAITGASPISVELLEWYKKLDIVIKEVYGMTENLAWATSNISDTKFGSIGKPWTNVQVRLTPEGELQTKGDATMLGYYKMPDLTKETFTSDGFLKSGDLAQIDSQGFYFITGRIKDQFKTDKGKYIAPLPIEMKFSSNTDIEQVCVVGMGVPQPMVLVVLSAAGKAKAKDEVIKSLTETLESVNKELESYEKLHAAVVMKDDWTVPNGLITPSLKVKRNEVEKIHLPTYPRWYNVGQKVVFE
ncbi:MAG TPA: AMP-binding protein [Cyclobacteriaceae bacterium]|nr:AMP-binding protein [Cyclobacteriaceae bacterium]